MIKTINFSAGLATGAVLGMVAFLVLDPVKGRKKRCIRKKVHCMAKAMGNAMDSFSNMF